MVFKKKEAKTINAEPLEIKENTELDKELVSQFNSFIQDNSVVNPDLFFNQGDYISSIILFGMYRELKEIKESLHRLENANNT